MPGCMCVCICMFGHICRDLYVQVLVYPAIPTIGRLTESLTSNAYSPVLNESIVGWFKKHTYKDWRDLYHPFACPINLARHIQQLQLLQQQQQQQQQQGGSDVITDNNINANAKTVSTYVAAIDAPLPRVAPALLVTADLDMLRDEGEQYGDLLEASGTSVDVLCVYCV